MGPFQLSLPPWLKPLVTPLVHSASTPADLKATRKRQSCHKLLHGNWNITSLTGEERELFAEVKRYRPACT